MAHILVCEDDPVFRDLVDMSLRAHGHAVTCTEDGAQAVRALKSGRFDLIITDIVMPDQDGLELIRAMRGMGASQPIVAVTAGLPEMRGIVQKAAAAMGANEVLLKPVQIPALIGRIEALLAP